MRRTIPVIMVCISSAGAMASDAPTIVADIAERAMAKGHGETCSLEMIPVPSGGYYPCLDFGPYRVVKEYGQTSGFVIIDGKLPYKVLTVTSDGALFHLEGPWETDMAARAVMFWNDVVEGGEARRNELQADRKMRQEADAYIRKLSGETDKRAPETPPLTTGAKDPVGPHTKATEEAAHEVLRAISGTIR